MANAEARIIRHNLLHADTPRRAEFDLVPSAVFADPQVASVGPTEQELRDRGALHSPGAQRSRRAGAGRAQEPNELTPGDGTDRQRVEESADTISSIDG